MIAGFNAELKTTSDAGLQQQQTQPVDSSSTCCGSKPVVDDYDLAEESPSSPSSTGEEEKDGNFSLLRRNASVEFLSPPHESDLRKSSLLAATFNMVATIIGGGILSIPLSFQKAGLVPGTILFIISAVATAFSLYILCSCARRTGSTSYTGVVRVAFGPGIELATTLLLCIFLLFVITAFMVLVKNIWSPIISLVFSSEDNIVLFLLLLLISPLILRRDLHALRHNCYIGFVSITVLCCAVAYRAYDKNTANTTLFADHAKFVASSWSDALFALPLITLNFLCSFNILSVHGALVNPTRARVQSVINLSLFAAFIVSYIFGVVGYLYAYDDTKGNLLLNFDPADSVILLGRIGCGITLMAGIPMIVLPCRDALLSLAPQYHEWKQQQQQQQYSNNQKESVHQGDFDNYAVSEHTTLLPQEKTGVTSSSPKKTKFEKKNDMEVKQNSIAYYSATFAIVGLAFVGATLAPGVATVWSICGSGMAFIVAFILPASCYIKIRHQRKGHGHKVVVLSWILLIFAILSAVACTLQTFWRLLIVEK